MKPEEKNKTDLPTNSKWQIGLFLWQKAARVQASAQHQKGRFFALAGFQRAAALGAPLVTFPATGKSPGCRAERLHWWVLGLPAPHKLPRGAGRSARSWGAVGAQPPLWGAGAKSDDLLPRGRSPLANPLAAHGRGKILFIKKIRRPRDLGKLAAALLPVGEKPLHLPPEGGAVVVM